MAYGAQASWATGICVGPSLLVCGLHKEGAGGSGAEGRRAEGMQHECGNFTNLQT